MQQHVKTVESIDRDRGVYFERTGARPVSRLMPAPLKPDKEVLKAGGRRRTAAGGLPPGSPTCAGISNVRLGIAVGGRFATKA
jgi:hypothetical protein